MPTRALCAAVAVTIVACATAHPVSRSPAKVGTSRVYASGYRNVRPLAGLATLSCPLVMRHAQSLRDTTYQLNDTASQLVVMDASLGRAELVRLTITGSMSGPTTVTVLYALSDDCARAILAAIDHLLVAQHEGDSTTLAAGPVEIGPSPKVFTVFGGIPARGPFNELGIAMPPHSYVGGVVFHAFVLVNDGSRRELQSSGYKFGSDTRGPEMQFFETVTETPFARIRGVEISANTVIRVDHIVWWSGDPSKRIVWP